MSIKELYRDDLLNRYANHTFTETTVEDMTLVEFKNGSSVVIARSQKLAVADAYKNIRNNLVGDGEILITIDETQRDALTSIAKGTLINKDGDVEIYNGTTWDSTKAAP